MVVQKHREVTDKILRAFFDVYNELGNGYLESVYQESMVIAMQGAGLDVRREVETRYDSAGTSSETPKPTCWSMASCWWSSRPLAPSTNHIKHN